MGKPLILISNDDGITSHGIRTLIKIASKIAEVVVVAPNSPQSGMGHAITIGNTLRLDETDIFRDIKAFECSGTPADCIKLAKHIVLKDRVPDLVLSGINHGSNSSISVLYSGTMSAAIEAAIEGLPAIGFSLGDHNPNASLDHCEAFVEKIIQQGLTLGIPLGIALNVNIPPASQGEIKGIKVCRQALAKWEEKFEQRFDPYGRRYFWMNGNFLNRDEGKDTDEWALSRGYISIVPCSYDLTAHSSIDAMSTNWKMNI